MIATVFYHGELAPHRESSKPERRRGKVEEGDKKTKETVGEGQGVGDKVGHVEEKELLMPEEVEVVEVVREEVEVVEVAKEVGEPPLEGDDEYMDLLVATPTPVGQVAEGGGKEGGALEEQKDGEREEGSEEEVKGSGEEKDREGVEEEEREVVGEVSTEDETEKEAKIAEVKEKEKEEVKEKKEEEGGRELEEEEGQKVPQKGAAEEQDMASPGEDSSGAHFLLPKVDIEFGSDQEGPEEYEVMELVGGMESVMLPAPLPLVVAPSPPTPPGKPLAKPKKKLSKHSPVGKKYAPGDYTNVPVLRRWEPGASPGSSEASQLPYRSFIISSAVDHRLRSSPELPAELQLQCMAKSEYEAVLVSLVMAAPADRPGRREEAERATEEPGRLGGKGELGRVCGMLCCSLGQLLAAALQPQSSVERMGSLQLWSELNGLLLSSSSSPPLPPHHLCSSSSPPPPPPRSTRHSQQLTGSDSPNQTVPSGGDRPTLCSDQLLLQLIECLSCSPSRAKMWQVGFSLLRQCFSQLSTPHPSASPPHLLPSPPLTISVPRSQLFDVLVAFFMSGETAIDVEGGVVSALLKELAPLVMVTSDGGGGDGERGAHLLLEVLVHVLDKR